VTRATTGGTSLENVEVYCNDRATAMFVSQGALMTQLRSIISLLSLSAGLMACASQATPRKASAFGATLSLNGCQSAFPATGSKRGSRHFQLSRAAASF
jgi:hypothetical protein